MFRQAAFVFKNINIIMAKAKSGSRFHIEFLNPTQRLAWGLFQQHDVLFLIGPAGTGKAQPLDSAVYTPFGKKLMGEMKIGDLVCNADGGTSKVLSVFPQGLKKIYRIYFVDGDYVECCREHLWEISSKSTWHWENRILNTEFILNNCKSKRGRRRFTIKVPKSVYFERQKICLDPYLFGLLLGDGCFRRTYPIISSSDDFIVQYIRSIIDEEYVLRQSKTRRYDYSLVKRERSNGDNKYTVFLKQLGLWGCLSCEKFVPDIYLYNTPEIRLSVLQGLMDTDGTVNKYSVSFCTTSSKLAKNVKFLVESLGGICTIRIYNKKFKYNGKIKIGRPSYNCFIKYDNTDDLFRLPRKSLKVNKRVKYLTKRIIDKVEYVGEKPAQCIYLDSHDGLYLTDNFIITHNTYLATAFAISEVLQSNKKRIILTRPIIEAGESLGYLPGDFLEKVDPYMIPFFDCLHELVQNEEQRKQVEAVLEIAPLAYMRGRSVTLDTLLYTKSGLKQMRDIKVNDLIIGSSGKEAKVLNVYPQGKLPVYKVIFSDKTFVKCSADHLWTTMNLSEKRHNKGYTVKNTIEIKDTLKTRFNQKNHRIPLSSAVEFNDIKVPIHPYILGTLLGDGHLGNNQIGFTTADNEIIEIYNTLLSENLKIVHKCNNNYRIVRKNGTKNEMLQSIKDLKLYGKKSNTKFIPDIYKFNSVNNRIELLRGLLDTDGWICRHRSGNCRIQYCSNSKQLVYDVMFLVRSLGGLAYYRKREFDELDSHYYKGKIIRHVDASYIVDINIPVNPFRIKRKVEKYNFKQSPKLISSVEYCGEEECQCIEVDSQDQLYVVNDFILTHNTFKRSICIFDEAQNATKKQLKLFLSRFSDNSKIIITGDPSQSDIGNASGLMDVVHRIETVAGVSVITFGKDCIVRHPMVLAILDRLED
jgi:phosphate starvation-inducible PhoH-like protein